MRCGRSAETPKPVPLSKLKDGFLDGNSSTYLEDLEERYRSDPASVDKSWSSFFRSLGALLSAPLWLSSPPFVNRPEPVSRSELLVVAEQGVAPEAVAEAFHAFEQGSQVAPLSAAAVSNQSIQESMRLLLLVRAYQVCTMPAVITIRSASVRQMNSERKADHGQRAAMQR